MATKLFPCQQIRVVVVPDAEKENVPPFPVSKLSLGAARPPKPIKPERVFRDITRAVHKEAEVLGLPRGHKSELTSPVFCRV